MILYQGADMKSICAINKPASALSERLMHRLKRLQQKLRAAMDKSLSEVALTGPQYAVLAALEGIPGSSSAEIARECFVTAQTLNEIVQGLTANRLIRRQEPARGRKVKLFLTRGGRERLVRAHQIVMAVEKNTLLYLKPREQAQFLGLLDLCGTNPDADG